MANALDHPKNKGETVGLTATRLNRSDDGKYDLGDGDYWQQNKANQQKDGQGGNKNIDGIADLKINGFAAMLVDKGRLLFLELPDHERTDDITEWNQVTYQHR